METIGLPGVGRKTTRLGYGCAYLLPETAYLLDVAYEAGVRHFDVARSYGQGLSEVILGPFLKRRPDATVTTKYGVRLGSRHPLNAAARAAIGPWVRRLRGALGAPVRSPLEAAPQQARAPATALPPTPAVFPVELVEQALAVSLRVLKRDRVDLFLLHEAAADELIDDRLLAMLEAKKAAGVIGEFGVGGASIRMPDLYEQRRPYCRVLQTDWTPVEPVPDRPDVFSILFRVFGAGANGLRQRLADDASLRLSWSQQIGVDLAEPGAFERLLLKAALLRRPDSMVLVYSSRAENIRSNVETAHDASLAAPARAFIELAHRVYEDRDLTEALDA